jgi:dihydrofolate reductase
MGIVTCQLSISLDGYLAGPNPSVENPIGEGGMLLHRWHRDPVATEVELAEQMLHGNGAFIMGRKMFGGGDGDWNLDWTGWWGDDPPYHAPTYVLTNYEREPVPMQGGTTFYFVTGGIESALAQAKAAAPDQDVAIAGGASTVQQYLRAGLIDELQLHIAPVILGAGERLLDNIGKPALECVSVIDTPGATHVKYRVG